MSSKRVKNDTIPTKLHTLYLNDSPHLFLYVIILLKLRKLLWFLKFPSYVCIRKLLNTTMKEPILQKSCDLFLKFGYKCITMDDIANALAISKKTLYKCFKNKNELVEASTAFFHSQVHEMISHIRNQKHNAIKENFEITAIFKNIFTETKELPMFQLNKYYPKTYKNFIENEFRIFEEVMSDNLRRGVSEGLYRKDFDIDGILRYYFILVMNIHEHQIFKQDKPSSHEFPILEYHTRAIATEKGLKELNKQIDNRKSSNEN